MSDYDAVRQALIEQAGKMRKRSMREMFAADPGRGGAFSLQYGDLYVDYSRNLIDGTVLGLLRELAEHRGLREKISDLFSGGIVNRSESRPALHTLLRQTKVRQTTARQKEARQKEAGTLSVDGENVVEMVNAEREKMFRLCRRLRGGEVTGSGGKVIGKLVNIGIGGSDLGPRLLSQALEDYRDGGLEVDFVANIDPAALRDVLARCDPQTTMFVVVSKSFRTAETLHNAAMARQWLQQRGCDDCSRHFIGVSENVGAMETFGIAPEHCFRIWPWVGGRYSLWSCAGFAACAILGEECFSGLLAGGAAMDDHFLTAPFAENIPVSLGLLGFWYINLLGYPSHAVVPYAHRLRLLPEYLGQLVMESNGKSVTADGAACDYDTAAILWGGAGSNAQHAFFQLLHQGSRNTSLDLIAIARSDQDQQTQDLLLANCIAQGKALLEGKPDRKQPHRHCGGNRPSTTLLFDALTPYNLGMLIALYEHKTFVEASLWDINAFDQWGVELGKNLAGEIGAQMRDQQAAATDSSSAGLLAFYRRCLQSRS